MIKKWIETVIFNVKWILIVFYLKLVWTLLLLLYTFMFSAKLQADQLISTLEDLDIVMIANLIKMIITGSYNSFVDKNHGYHNENISSGSLKIKMGTSLIGVSSIHLLQTFVSTEGLNPMIWKQIAIHVAFILGGFMLAVIDRIHVKSEDIELETEHKEKEREHLYSRNKIENHAFEKLHDRAFADTNGQQLHVEKTPS